MRTRTRLPFGTPSRPTVGASIAVIAVAAVMVATAPAHAQTTFWNFANAPGNWTTSGEKLEGTPYPKYLWQYLTSSTSNGGPQPHWRAESEGTTVRSTSAYYLASESVSGISGTVPANSARISIAHNFLFQTGTSGLPLWAGQFEYQLNNSGTWVGLPFSAFSTGSVSTFNAVFGFSPFWSGTSLQYVDQPALVVPSYLTPTGTSAFPFVAPGAATFIGASAGQPSAYVPSQVLISVSTGEVPAGGITSLQMRFTNLNRGAGCNPTDGWNVRFVQVDFSSSLIPVPEPAALALAGSALAALAVGARLRRRRHQRHSRPSDSPWTTTLPPVLVEPTIAPSAQSLLD